MNKLLQANFLRMKKNRLLRLCVIAMLVFAVIITTYQYNNKLSGYTATLDSVFNLPYIISGILLAVLCSLFIGTEFSDGTIRNKVIVGSRRRDIYLANFIVCAAAGLFMNLVFFTVAFLLGIPLLGFFAEGAHKVLMTFLAGIMMTISFSAIFTLITMMSQNKAMAAIICSIGILGAIFMAGYLYSALGEQELVDAYMLDSSSALIITSEGDVDDEQMQIEKVPNARYVKGFKRSLYQFLLNFPPSGQMVLLVDQSSPNLTQMTIYSIIIIITANLTGVLIFKRKDLK